MLHTTLPHFTLLFLKTLIMDTLNIKLKIYMARMFYSHCLISQIGLNNLEQVKDFHFCRKENVSDEILKFHPYTNHIHHCFTNEPPVAGCCITSNLCQSSLTVSHLKKVKLKKKKMYYLSCIEIKRFFFLSMCLFANV